MRHIRKVIVIEKHIVLEDIDPVVFYGIGNQHLQMLRALYPKLRIVARDNVIRILGDEEQMAAFEESAERIRQHVVRFNALKEKTAKKIILSRPAVEAGEKLGFLPGDMKDKIDPYLQPLYDAAWSGIVPAGNTHHYGL